MTQCGPRSCRGRDRGHIGWSGGGPHALACAAVLPDRIRAVATIGGVAPYPAEGLDFLEGMGEENIEEFNAALGGSRSPDVFKERNWPILRAVTPMKSPMHSVTSSTRSTVAR